MAFCPDCGKQNPDSAAFCSGCGKSLTQPAAPQMPAEPPVYRMQEEQQPVYKMYNEAPVAQQAAPAEASSGNTGAKVMGIIGMALGILSLVFSFVSFISLIGYSTVETVSIGLTYSIMAIMFSIPGKILSSKAVSGGATGKPAKLGNIFSLIGIIAGGVTFLISFIQMVSLF